jgi:hypothetical protein
MSKISRDGSASGSVNIPLHPRENFVRSVGFTSISADTAIPADGCGTLFFQVSGTFVGTVQVEGSVDGTNWYILPLRPFNVASKAIVLSTSSPGGNFIVMNPGFPIVRQRATAYTSGTIGCVLNASNAVFDAGAEWGAANQTGTITAAASAAATLTLASPGAGLRHYLTNLRIEAHASALLTAGVTPVLVTTTNLPGSRVFSIPADARAAGAVYEKVESWSKGLAASAQNVATTIVAPVSTGVIWRITADYYVAP